MIYNNPIAYGVDVTPAILRDLVNVPGIVCVKEESGDIRRVTDLYNEHGDRFQVFCGVDDLLLESVALGVTGWVSGMTNAWPAECVEIFNLCRAGRYDEARGLYRLMTPAFHLDTHVKLVQYIKLAEHLAYGAPEWARSPRLPLEGAEPGDGGHQRNHPGPGPPAQGGLSRRKGCGSRWQARKGGGRRPAATGNSGGDFLRRREGEP
jgi:4-hydroxy-tetrahydrodipicolinate synthase